MAGLSHIKRRNLILMGILAFIALITSGCSSKSGDDEGFSLRRSYTLRSGTQLQGDQVVLAADIELESESQIAGDVTLTSNDITLNGTITGDVVAVSDKMIVGADAHITGDLVVCAKDFQLSDQAQIDGKVKEECTDSGTVSAANVIESVWKSWRDSSLFRISSVFVGSLLFGALAALSALAFPVPLVRMSESVQRSPVRAGGIGFLTILVAVGLTVVYVISLLLVLPIVLLPFVMVGWFVVILFSLLGWVALAVPLGIYLMRMVGMDRQPRMVAAAVGGIVLGLLLRLWSIFWFTAWIGVLATIILGSIGLGAVILTHVGTKPYPRARHNLTTAP
ncbi:MAG: polymer-forming cytoskeletal protein [Anaerolineae bacterium]|nr:polymer-forming cytoskeletal protein [Anaerolineae bacterium]